MIVTDLHLQAMHCTVCNEAYEIPRRVLRDQHAVVEMREQLELEHEDCAAYRDRPELAAANRKFNRNLQRELARSAA